MPALKILTITFLLTLVGGAQAQSMSARAGSNGLGAEVGVDLGSIYGLRAHLAAGSYTRQDTESNVYYEGKLKLSNGALLFDLHPFAGGFRLSAGAIYNNNQLEATGRSQAGTIEINGIYYPATEVGTLQAAVRWDKASPYLGLGWSTRRQAAGGMVLNADVGAFYQRPTASLTGTCGATVPALACQQLQSDIRAEEQQFRDEINKYKLFPVLSIGVGYRF